MRSVPSGLAEKLVASADHFTLPFDDLRIEDIARTSGIPRATLYYYFAGKEEILAFMLDTLLARYRERVSQLADRAADPYARLVQLVTSQLELLAASPGAAALLQLNLGRIGKLPDIASAAQETFLGPLQAALSDGVRAGLIAAIDVQTTAIALLGAVIFVGFHGSVLGNDLSDIDIRTRADDIVALVWNGMAVSRRTEGE